VKNFQEKINIADIFSALAIYPGDTVFIHGDAGVSLQYHGVHPQKKLYHLFCEIINYLGPAGTLVIPTFSYSFTKGEDFNPSTTPSRVGLFSNFFLSLDNVKRSSNPIFSVAAIGKHANLFMESNINDCFGKDTAFDLLMSTNAVSVCLGCELKNMTFVHYVEQKNKVKYRYFKSFFGNLIINKKKSRLKTTYFVRELNDEYKIDLNYFQNVSAKKGKLLKASIGRFPVYAINVQNFTDIASKLLAANQYALIKKNCS
jgi:aminoglycoside 3-N-acetyltransferase